LFGVEGTAFAVLIAWVLFGSPSWGPEGPVGGWLIGAVPPLLLGIPLVLFLFGKSERSKQSAVFLLALPLLQAVLGPLYDAFESYQVKRFVEGDSMFTKPVERELAHALRAHDAELVKSLIPRVGDLNVAHRGGDSTVSTPAGPSGGRRSRDPSRKKYCALSRSFSITAPT